METVSDLALAIRELRRVAVFGGAHEESSGLALVRSWDASQLLLADERCRASEWWSADDQSASVAEAMDRGDRQLATWLASMGRDGFARQRAVGRLAVEPGADADRLVALRIADPVAWVRVLAWRVLASRLSVVQAPVVAPLLVRLSGRSRAAGAMAQYASLFSQRRGVPLWRELMKHGDRVTRRWAFGTAIRQSALTSGQAVQLLAEETDQLVAAQLVRVIVGSGDRDAVGRLLRSRHAPARAAAVISLPDDALSDSAITAALFDRAATVKAAARSRAAARGIATGPLYRQVWHEKHDPRALRGAAESGERFHVAELRSYLDDHDPRVRSAAVDLLGGVQLADQDIDHLLSLLRDSSPGPASRAVRVLLDSPQLWSYPQVANLWPEAGTHQRRGVWRLLHGRGGWDRIRADLLAASDEDPGISGSGRSDLEAWSQHAAARMWREPTKEQHDDLLRLLPAAGLRLELRQAIEFRANLPVTQRPRRTWDPLDAVMLIEVGRRCRLPGAWTLLLDLLKAAVTTDGYELHQHTALNKSLGRLHAAGLVRFKPPNAFKLTSTGRRLLKSNDADRAHKPDAVQMRLNELDVPQHEWVVTLDTYGAALAAHDRRSQRSNTDHH